MQDYFKMVFKITMVRIHVFKVYQSVSKQTFISETVSQLTSKVLFDTLSLFTDRQQALTALHHHL